MKSDLTPIERIQADYFHFVVGLTQMQVATVLNISNHGRVNEAINAVAKAVGLSEGGYKQKQPVGRPRKVIP